MSRKRGLSGLVISIIVVLVALVAVVIVYSFAGQTEQPSGIVEQCTFACDSGQRVSFCEVKRKVTDSLSLSCDELLATQYSNYGVQPCATISCALTEIDENSQQASDQTCSGLEGSWETPSAGQCPSKEGFYSRIRTAQDSPPAEGQICCYYYE